MRIQEKLPGISIALPTRYELYMYLSSPGPYAERSEEIRLV